MKSYSLIGVIAVLLVLVEGCATTSPQSQGQANAVGTGTATNSAGVADANTTTTNTTANNVGNSSANNTSNSNGGNSTASNTSGNEAPGNSSASLSPDLTATGGYGWKFVNLDSTFGAHTTIDGLAIHQGQMQVTIRHDNVQGEGMTFSDTGYTGLYNPLTNHVTKTGQFTKTQPEMGQPSPVYNGPFSLVFPSDFPEQFQQQSVTLEKDGKPVDVSWPTSIVLYGSAANPQSALPGSLDNQILGQSGDYLWLALKGPQYPPFYKTKVPQIWGFRYWNRIVALNVQTGTAVEYTIPRTYSLYQSEVSGTISLVNPSFLVTGGNVWVGIGSWIGKFPATPAATGNTGTVINGQSPVLVAPPSSYIRSQEIATVKDLTSREQVEAGSLASYWNHVVGATVPGVPPYQDYQNGKLQAWNVDPVIFNHGVLPGDITWALEFPLAAGDPVISQRATMEQAIAQMLSSKLNSDAIGLVPKSDAQVKAEFGGKPPLSLPGYQIKGDAYWPVSQGNS